LDYTTLPKPWKRYTGTIFKKNYSLDDTFLWILFTKSRPMIYRIMSQEWCK
jgi:hypothetical protein